MTLRIGFVVQGHIHVFKMYYRLLNAFQELGNSLNGKSDTNVKAMKGNW